MAIAVECVTPAPSSKSASAVQGLAIRRVPIGSLVIDPANARAPDDASPTRSGELRNRARVIVKCPDCDRSRSVRVDTLRGQPHRCKSCSSKKNYRPRPRSGPTMVCAHCGESFYRHPSETTKRFCSASCGNIAKRRYERSERACRECGSSFEYAPRPFSNSSGEYCSRACKHAAFLGVINGNRALPAATDRPGWRSRRDRFVQDGNDFCAICGTDTGRLHVHHIEGHRNVAFDDLSTVVTVCPSHHGALEPFTTRISRLSPLRRRHAALVLLGLLGDSLATRRGARMARRVCA